MDIPVTYEQFSIIAARATVLQDMMEMLLAREITEQTEFGQFWTERAEIARADLADESKWTIITPNPVRTSLQELVAIVDAAAELAPSAQIRSGSGAD